MQNAKEKKKKKKAVMEETQEMASPNNSLANVIVFFPVFIHKSRQIDGRSLSPASIQLASSHLPWIKNTS